MHLFFLIYSRYEYTRNTDRYWRKNLGRNGGGGCVGVDLNRNWGYKWGGKGASKNPCRYDKYTRMIVIYDKDNNFPGNTFSLSTSL